MATSETSLSFAQFAEGRAPFRSLKPEHFRMLVDEATDHHAAKGETILEIDDAVPGLYVLTQGDMELIAPGGDILQHMQAGDFFGHRSMLRDSGAIMRVVATRDSDYTIIPAQRFHLVCQQDPSFAGFFSRSASTPDRQRVQTTTMANQKVGDTMTANPVTVRSNATVHDAATLMSEKSISCILVVDESDRLVGIVTSGDLVRHVIAAGNSAEAPITAVMTDNPVTVSPEETLLAVVVEMTERRISHMPVTSADGSAIGILTQSDLVRRNSNSLVFLIHDIARQTTFDGLASVVARKPLLLAELVGAGIDGHQIGRLMTGVSDAVTKRLLAMALLELGPAPAPWLWLACGSQGREEQTGVSDQDNCLMLGDTENNPAHDAYFERMAKFVSDGLDACGYYYCPGDMMATNPKWRQPVRVWKRYFNGWIDKPDPMAQMLASVMFDLRPIAGDKSLFGDLNRETLAKASRDSIFRSHMIANSLKHTVPLGLFGGLTYSREKEHRNSIDMKHSGVVPITDLARVYALEGRIEAVNTRDRLIAARDMDGVLSKTGGDDLIDAYDLIVDLRLSHQVELIRAGRKPDNFLVPDTLSAFERNHLKDAFSVVKRLQSSAGYGLV